MIVEKSVISASIGQQIFTISSGVAGGLAGFLLAYRLKTSSHVHLKPLLLASLISAVATFGAVLLITAPTSQSRARLREASHGKVLPVAAN
jgi:hypothetical protein